MISVVHNPLGQEHPYEQLPEERFPRQPLADQPFTVGITTRPPGAVQIVTVFSQIGDSEPVSISAARLDQWQPDFEEGVGAEYLERVVHIEQDVWQVQLTAPPHGQTLHYWIEAAGDGETATSERFTLPGLSWQQNGGTSLDSDGVMRVSTDLTGIEDDLPRLAGLEWLTDGERAYKVRLSFNCASDERFYGLGERFNALNQRGSIMDIRVYEQYKNQNQRTYMPIPFLLSSAGFGVWVQSSRWMQFDLDASQDDVWTLEADLGSDQALSLQWFRDADPFAIIGQFAQMTGPVVLPPRWSFGLWMSGNEWNSQARVVREVEVSLACDIQPSVLVIEAWSDETTFYIWNDAQYTPVPGADRLRYDDFTFPPDGKWTDPKGMIDWLHERGIKVLLWQIPGLKLADHPHDQHDADRAYFEERGYGIREADGSLHRIRPFWFRGGYIWDVTNPEEREWWLQKRAYLLEDIGIDGFKTDGGEHLWGTNVRFADGRTGAEVWNEYPQRYTQAYYEFANRYHEAITFSRAGYTSSQRSPLHWAGDEHSTWEAFRHSIYAGLSAGISGIPFWGWDLGGFSGAIPTAELYIRAAAMAAFCPVMQYHSEFNAHREPNVDRTPWNIQERTGDERVIPVFRYFVNVRQQLITYIWREAQHSAETGQPMMRALQLIDPNASEFDYLFGRDLLVSPVVQPDAETWSVYLPEGQWRWLWSDEVFEGRQTVEVAVPLHQLPVFVRAGADIPVIASM
jgi:alpha-glucosidase (family GH31 glycosyl hydrolase)